MSEIQEVESLMTTAKYPGVKKVLGDYLISLKAKSSTPESDSLPKPPVKVPAPENVSTTSSSTTSSATSFIPIEDFYWDQGGYGSSNLSIYADLENVGSIKDNVKCNFTDSSFDLIVMDLNGKNYRLLKNNLEHDIIPEQSKFIVKKNKIVIKLEKKKGEYSYDTWTKLVSKKSKEEKKKSKDDPMGGIMDMMKNMYDEGDEQTKKMIGEAMLKSKRGERSDPTMPGMPDMPDMPDMKGF